MDFREITDRSSQQYKWQQKAKTSPLGLRTIDDKPMIAIVGYSVGTELKIVLEGGKEVDVIVGDIKADTNCLHSDGSMIEFVVDTKTLRSDIKELGSLNIVFKGNIIDIKTKEI